MRCDKAFARAVVFALTALPPSLWAQVTPPACRFSPMLATQVETTLQLALKGYQELGRPMPFDTLVVNPPVHPTSPRTLAAYVVTDATISTVDQNGCTTKSPATIKGEELDSLSVRGGCVAAASGKIIRCSADAVRIFGQSAEATGKPNPALLYVLSHELAHLEQRRPGEYAGRLQTIDLGASRQDKLQKLQDSCEPGLTQAEEDADEQALQILIRLLPRAPFREPVFSQRGSVLWGVDQLNLAANSWTSLALEREFISQAKPHRSFVPTEFPTPSSKVQANAKRFVCEVLTKKKGFVVYPGRSSTHPALEVRIQRVAEGLRPLASSLPATDGSREYQPVAVLQRQLSDLFTFMYRETGSYLQSMQKTVCTRVNSDKPTVGC